MSAAPVDRGPWIFGRGVDLAVFGGTACVALALVALAPTLGVPAGGDAPTWTWIVGVLLVDVAHVWSTALVTYLDPVERRRWPGRYTLVPIAAFAAGVLAYQLGPDVFWRGLAYVAVFHFVRQQYGWVRLYRARSGQPAEDRWGGLVDGAMIYAATLYPLWCWHAALPRAFSWMRDGDFATGLPAWTVAPATALYVLIATAYLVVAVRDARAGRTVWGKHVVVMTTAACWYVGIVATNTDYAFTVTNVFIHGVPYLCLVWLYARVTAARDPGTAAGLGARIVRWGLGAMLGLLWVVAYAEELLWHRGVWHEHERLFGGALALGPEALLVPLLATPQLTHYLVDAFLWRRRDNPRLGWL